MNETLYNRTICHSYSEHCHHRMNISQFRASKSSIDVFELGCNPLSFGFRDSSIVKWSTGFEYADERRGEVSQNYFISRALVLSKPGQISVGNQHGFEPLYIPTRMICSSMLIYRLRQTEPRVVIIRSRTIYAEKNNLLVRLDSST